VAVDVGLEVHTVLVEAVDVGLELGVAVEAAELHRRRPRHASCRSRARRRRADAMLSCGEAMQFLMKPGELRRLELNSWGHLREANKVVFYLRKK